MSGIRASARSARRRPRTRRRAPVKRRSRLGTLAWFVVVAVAVVGGLRYADGLATVGVNRVEVEADLTEAELVDVRRAVARELARPGARGAAHMVAAVEQLGWVHQVRVRRRWPETLHVAVVRETLAASWGGAGFLTTGGNVVPPPPDSARRVPSDLPVFKASVSNGVQAMAVYNLLNSSAQAAGLRIGQLEEDRAGNWTVVFANGIEVVLGATALRERFRRFIAVYRGALRNAVGRIDRVDARYHAGVSVRWASGVRIAAAAPQGN